MSIFPTVVARIDSVFVVWDNKIVSEQLETVIDNLQFKEKNKIQSYINEMLPAYISFLRDFNSKISNTNIVNQALQREINQQTLNIIQNGERAVESLSATIATKVKHYFRQQISPWMKQSVIMIRALEKPRGYPGDYQMLEYIYNNSALSKGIGYYFDKGFLDGELTVAVRNRKDIMANLLLKYMKLTNSITNLACGSCREIRDIKNKIPKNTTFTCVDMDIEALNFSKGVLSEQKIVYVKGDLINIAFKSDKDILNKPDLIYSIGLVDYFPDRILSKLITTCYSALPKNGKLILSFKDRNKYNPIREDWLTDWKFIPRTYNDATNLLLKSGIAGTNTECLYEPSGIIFFTVLTK